MTILLVDDDESFTRIIEAHAQALSISIHTVSTLKEGMEAIEKESYQAYIIDGYLPDGEGVELIRKIREKG